MHRRHLPLVFVFLSAVLLSEIAAADDWPQWRGPQRDGVWRETGIIKKFDGPQIPLLWRAKVHGGYTGPTVADGRVYLTDRLTEPEEMERVLCFDVKTGKPIWTHSYECVYEIQYRAGPRASVSIHDGRAYSLGAMAHFVCLDAVKGTVLWQKDLREEYRIRGALQRITSFAPEDQEETRLEELYRGGLLFMRVYYNGERKLKEEFITDGGVVRVRE